MDTNFDYNETTANISTRVAEKTEQDFSVLSAILNDILETQEKNESDEKTKAEIEDFLATHSKEEVAKYLAASMAIEKTKNGEAVDDWDIVSLAGIAASALMGVFEIASGEKTVDDVVEELVDLAECRLIVFIDQSIEVGAELVVPALVSVFPALEPVAPVLCQIVQYLKEPIKEAAHTLLHEIGQFAKETIPVIVERGKQTVKSIIKAIV